MRLRRFLDDGIRIIIPEIADYEVRRELIRAGKTAAVHRLDELADQFEFAPITSEIMRLAAGLWAEARRVGRPTSHPHALDGDVILAAQAEVLTVPGDHVVVVTTNVGHLNRFVETLDWDVLSTR